MNIETIGLNAGLVWAALNEAETVDTKQLKKNFMLLSDGLPAKVSSCSRALRTARGSLYLLPSNGAHYIQHCTAITVSPINRFKDSRS